MNVAVFIIAQWLACIAVSALLIGAIYAVDYFWTPEGDPAEWK